MPVKSISTSDSVTAYVARSRSPSHDGVHATFVNLVNAKVLYAKFEKRYDAVLLARFGALSGCGVKSYVPLTVR
jgi:hypothetical protein